MNDSERVCFCVMPIRTPGTAEHAHFRAVYSQLKPILANAGFTVLRADDIQKSGAITKDIVTHLAESELVIADLTDLNPNVFYELGVRHALRGAGTVMILDESRTPDVPFDLRAYRVIKFTGDLSGIDVLTQALSQYLTDAVADESSRRDNPVHDWYPMLPVNVLEKSAQSSTAPLRQTIKQLQDRLSAYEKAYGTTLPDVKSTINPLAIVVAAVEDAEQGNLPVSLMDSARRAFESRDVVTFLRTIRTVLEREIRLAPTLFLQLTRWAEVMDMDDVVKAVFEQALQFYPSDDNIKRSYLITLAHSDSPGDRERARQEITREMSTDITQDSLTGVSPDVLREDLDLITMVLDSFQRDDMYEQELKLVEKLVKALPDSTVVVRNYARALCNNQRIVEGLERHRAAVFCSDVDDTSAVWLGNELHNRRRHREAAEAYALACLLDPSDAEVFAHLAEEISIAMIQHMAPFAKQDGSTALPDLIDADSIIALAQCSTSCRNVDAEVADRLRRALDRLELLTLFDNSVVVTRPQRIEIADRIYSALRTNLTTKDTEYDFFAAHDEVPDAS